MFHYLKGIPMPLKILIKEGLIKKYKQERN